MGCLHCHPEHAAVILNDSEGSGGRRQFVM
jgi:hypothetical protein